MDNIAHPPIIIKDNVIKEHIKINKDNTDASTVFTEHILKLQVQLQLVMHVLQDIIVVVDQKLAAQDINILTYDKCIVQICQAELPLQEDQGLQLMKVVQLGINVKLNNLLIVDL